jgi:PAS domain S-box-containing protein
VKVLGALLFGHVQPGMFTARDERLAAGIAAQAAIALDNARLYREAQDAQKRLSQQLDFTRAITDSLAEGIYAVDRDGLTSFVNPAAERMLGYSREELLGRDMHELVHFRHADGSAFPKEQCPLLAVVKTGGTCQVPDDIFVRKDGTSLPVAYSSSPTMEEGQVVGAVVSFHDITQRKWAEEALRRSKEELERLVDERTTELRETNVALERSNRELQDFASVASHDLQEPLRKIQAFGDRLVAKVGDSLGPDAADYLQRMHKAAGRMQTLINDLLAFSRVTTKAQPFVPVELDQVVAEVLTDLETAVEKSGGRVDVSPLPRIEADPMQMRQLLQNLVANALKFRRPGVPPVVQVSATVDEIADSCQITVKDNGIGFDEKYLDRIFNVFQRLHNRTQYEGTGIGLAVCRKIAQRHGGSITAHSTPDEGSTFMVTLPVRQT